MLAKAVSILVPLSKANAKENEAGEWIVSGPIAPETPDYEGDALPDALIRKGLSFYGKFGSHNGKEGQVDWGHRYAKTGLARWLIGRGLPFDGPDGRAWLRTRLFKGKEAAQDCWQHLQEGGHAGYSLDGLMRATTHPKTGKRIPQHLEIHRVTIDPSPLGFGNFLQVGIPANTLAVSKALATDFSDGLEKSGWVPERELTGFALVSDPRMDALFRLLKAMGMDGGDDDSDMEGGDAMQKAALAGSGIIQAGQTGAATLRPQTLLGGHPNGVGEQARCSHCNCKNLTTRAKCRKCGRAMKTRLVQKGALPSDAAAILEKARAVRNGKFGDRVLLKGLADADAAITNNMITAEHIEVVRKSLEAYESTRSAA